MTEAQHEKFGDSTSLHTLEGHENPLRASQNGVVTVGNFDGVHRGHAELIQQARELAQKIAGPLTAVTFNPHPLQLLAPERFLPQLTAAADKARYLRQAGADSVVFLRTSPALLRLSAAEFFRTILIERFQAKGIVEGFNFRFGHDRAGSVETLKDLCADAGIQFQVVEPFQLGGVTVSSSRVRDALTSGDVKLAAELMGRPYLVRGVVATGAQRGRSIGFPTANLEGMEVLPPGDGVYAVHVWLGDRRFPGAANVGPNPTFGENTKKMEVHLIGFTGDLYGQTLVVEFMERLREVREFSKVDDLIQQLKRDVEDARRLIGGGNAGG